MGSLSARRKELMLGALLLGLVVVLWENLGEDAGGIGLSSQGSVVERHPDVAGLRVFPVQWEVLAASPPPYDPAGRNIFQFGRIKPPPPPKPTAEELAAIREAQRKAEEERRRQAELLQQQQLARQNAAEQQQAQQANQPPPPPPPPPKPKPPPINYRFIGYIGPAENKIAVLHDGTGLVFVHQNEEIGKGLRVLEIGYESIKFGFTDPQFEDETRTLPMSSSL